MIEPTNEMIDVFMREEARQADLGASTRHATRRAIAAVLALVERDYHVRPKPPWRPATPHAFVRSDDPHFGSAFGGSCAAVIHGTVCGWPELAHRPVTPPGDIVQQPLTSGPPAEPDHGRLP